MSDSRADANLAKPVVFETKDLPGGYAPAATPEFHQQNRDPGYSNSGGPEGDGGGEEWAVADSTPKFSDTPDASAASGGDDKKSSTTTTRSGGKAANANTK